MKKFFIIVMTVIMCLMCTFSVCAEANTKIYAEETKLIKDDIVLIPIEIENNSGIMGFKINVSYPTDCIKIVSVSRGSLTKSGNFNTNYGTADGTFDVLWNETSNINGDGSLFVIGVKALTYFDSKSISIGYSQDDTFDENWKDVIFTCEKINVSCNEDEQNITTTSSDKENDSVTSAENTVSYPNNEQIIDAVNITLEQFNAKTFDDIKDSEKIDFVSALNKNLNTIVGNSGETFQKFKEAKRRYDNAVEENFSQKAIDLIDGSEIKAAIDAALEDFDVGEISEIPEDKQKKFINSVENNLKTLNEDVPSITENVDEDTALTAVKKLYGNLKLVEASEDYIAPSKINFPVIIGAILITIAILIIVLIILKRKKGAVK